MADHRVVDVRVGAAVADHREAEIQAAVADPPAAVDIREQEEVVAVVVAGVLEAVVVAAHTESWCAPCPYKKTEMLAWSATHAPTRSEFRVGQATSSGPSQICIMPSPHGAFSRHKIRAR